MCVVASWWISNDWWHWDLAGRYPATSKWGRWPMGFAWYIDRLTTRSVFFFYLFFIFAMRGWRTGRLHLSPEQPMKQFLRHTRRSIVIKSSAAKATSSSSSSKRTYVRIERHLSRGLWLAITPHRFDTPSSSIRRPPFRLSPAVAAFDSTRRSVRHFRLPIRHARMRIFWRLFYFIFFFLCVDQEKNIYIRLFRLMATVTTKRNGHCDWQLYTRRFDSLPANHRRPGYTTSGSAAD